MIQGSAFGINYSLLTANIMFFLAVYVTPLILFDAMHWKYCVAFAILSLMTRVSPSVTSLLRRSIHWIVGVGSPAAEQVMVSRGRY